MNTPLRQPVPPSTYFTNFPRLCLSFFPPALLQCELGELVCERGSPGCIPLQKRCDHSADCLPFHSDESSCNGNMFLLTFPLLSFLLLYIFYILWLPGLEDMWQVVHTVPFTLVYSSVCSFCFHQLISDSKSLWHSVKICFSSWMTGFPSFMSLFTFRKVF